MEQLTRNVSLVEINNSAVAFAQSGRSQEAMELFQLALSNLRDQFSRGASSAPNFEDTVDNNSTHAMDCYHHHRFESQEPASASCAALNLFASVPKIQIPQDQSFLALYDRALLVDPSSGCNNEASDAAVSAVILFNMALLHHFRGLTGGQTDFLDRASRLYRIALDILQKHNDNTNILLVLALYNNLAHIDSHLFRVEDMKHSLGQMQDILSTDDSANECILPFDEDDYLIFSMNAMLGNEREFTLAPAA
jgi:tetratricopeptide (TPR) repeat protein